LSFKPDTENNANFDAGVGAFLDTVYYLLNFLHLWLTVVELGLKS